MSSSESKETNEFAAYYFKHTLLYTFTLVLGTLLVGMTFYLILLSTTKHAAWFSIMANTLIFGLGVYAGKISYKKTDNK